MGSTHFQLLPLRTSFKHPSKPSPKDLRTRTRSHAFFTLRTFASVRCLERGHGYSQSCTLQPQPQPDRNQNRALESNYRLGDRRLCWNRRRAESRQRTSWANNKPSCRAAHDWRTHIPKADRERRNHSVRRAARAGFFLRGIRRRDLASEPNQTILATRDWPATRCSRGFSFDPSFTREQLVFFCCSRANSWCIWGPQPACYTGGESISRWLLCSLLTMIAQ